METTMSVGNDYQLWVATPGETPTYVQIVPQRDMSVSDSRQTQEAGHKNSGGFELARSGNRSLSVSMDFVAILPDAGMTIVATAYKAGTPIEAQLRKDGALGDGTTDVVFACSMLVTTLARTDPYNGTSTGSLGLVPFAVPTVDKIAEL